MNDIVQNGLVTHLVSKGSVLSFDMQRSCWIEPYRVCSSNASKLSCEDAARIKSILKIDCNNRGETGIGQAREVDGDENWIALC